LAHTRSQRSKTSIPIKNELEAIDYNKTMAKYELQNINNQIAILNRDIYNKRNEIAYLHLEVQELEEYLRGLNHIQQPLF
jgi:flagellar biosynthesis chaperone FliJ